MSSRRRPARLAVLTLVALLLAAALVVAPVDGAKKAAAAKAKKGGAAPASKVGVLDTDDDDADGPVDGYGNLGWITVDQFEKLDLSTNKKPIFFLLSQPWCGACKALKASLVQSEKVLAPIARDFIMVNAAGDGPMRTVTAYPGGDKLGGYVPRGVFATPGGALRPELTAPGGAAPDSQYPHFYPDANAVGGGLVTARARMAKAGVLVPGGGGGAAGKKKKAQGGEKEL